MIRENSSGFTGRLVYCYSSQPLLHQMGTGKKDSLLAGGIYCAQLRQSMGAFVVFVQAVKQRKLNEEESNLGIFAASHMPRLLR